MCVFSLFFNTSENPFIQARAEAIAALVPNAIFHRALLQPKGIEEVFGHPNEMLDLTTTVYVS
jgi:hypothetical protein